MKAINICFFTFLAVFFFCLQNIDCTQYDEIYTYPNTVDNDNIKERNAALRQLVKDLMSSRFMPHFSCTARKFIESIFSYLDTESQSLLNTFVTFSLYAFPYLLHAPSEPSLCLMARNINGSVKWENDRDGKSTAKALTSLANNVNTFCSMLKTAALLELGCGDVCDPPELPSNCYTNGYSFDVMTVLDLFGENLPRCLYDGIFDLYNSNEYTDKVLSAAMTSAVTPEAQNLISAYDVNLLMEPSYLLLDNDESSGCCSKLRDRFDLLCPVVNTVSNTTIVSAIENTYLSDNCEKNKIKLYFTLNLNLRKHSSSL